LRFLAVSIAALALIASASGQQTPAAKKKAVAAPAKTKPVHPVAGTAKAGAAKAGTKAGTAKASVSKSVASKSLASKAGAPKPAASKTGSIVASNVGAKSRRAVVARRPPSQQQPTADRYKEIQQALADKGYFQGPVDGAWNTGSVDALKRFQKDQNLDPDGKIGSLSLIALGLGPKRGEAPAQLAPASSPADPPPVAQPRQ
jgi:peptidoglycan hydrolase-like protein with peptidoglycan-binding domain